MTAVAEPIAYSVQTPHDTDPQLNFSLRLLTECHHDSTVVKCSLCTWKVEKVITGLHHPQHIKIYNCGFQWDVYING